jgi:hypothetical protein
LPQYQTDYPGGQFFNFEDNKLDLPNSPTIIVPIAKTIIRSMAFLVLALMPMPCQTTFRVVGKTKKHRQIERCFSFCVFLMSGEGFGFNLTLIVVFQ